MRRLVWFPLMLFFVAALPAQENPVEEPPAEEELVAKPFPLALLLEAAEFAERGVWQPDWPTEWPPDSFTASGDWVSVTVNRGEDRLSLRRGNGVLLDFPWLFEGALVQARLAYSENSGEAPLLKSVILEGIVDIEVLDYFNDSPFIFKVLREDVSSFAVLHRGVGVIVESWFDEEGGFLDSYEYGFSKAGPGRIWRYQNTSGEESGRRDFDSRFLITAINGPEGDFSLDYREENLPAYWTRREIDAEAREYALQWDEKGFLIRLSSSALEAGNFPMDSRYEYILDSKGNWTERREMAADPGSGLSAPVPAAIITRILEYR